MSAYPPVRYPMSLLIAAAEDWFFRTGKPKPLSIDGVARARKDGVFASIPVWQVAGMNAEGEYVVLAEIPECDFLLCAASVVWERLPREDRP